MPVYMRSTGPPSGPRSRDSPSSYSRRTPLSKSLKGRTSWGCWWRSGRPWRRRRPGTTAPATRPFVTSVWTTPSTRACLLKQVWRRPRRVAQQDSLRGGQGSAGAMPDSLDFALAGHRTRPRSRRARAVEAPLRRRRVKKVAVIGTGRMGGAFATAFAKRTSHRVSIRGSHN